MNAIILCSGPGTRMMPWTATKNKCLFKVNGEPLLERIIRDISVFNGPHSIFITCRNEEFNQFNKYINPWKFVSLINEKELTGSGSAIRMIFERYELDRAVIINGDTILDSKAYSLLADLYNRKHNYLFVDKPEYITGGFIRYDKRGKITRIDEKQPFDDADARYAGMSVLNKDVFKNASGDLMTHVLPRRKDLHAIKLNQPSIDIGILENYIKLTLQNYDNVKVQDLVYSNGNIAIPAIEKILRAERIFICGNGGSLSTANHAALDWSKVGKKEVIAITWAEHITAYGNDIGYKDVFVQQLNRYKITDKDVIVLISTSGTSPNVVKAGIVYNKIPMVLFTGRDKHILDTQYRLTVDSDSVRVIEDTHLAYIHSITEIMEGLCT